MERDEPALANLPRLVFRFNRRDHGRLRILIDLLNSYHPPSDVPPSTPVTTQAQSKT
jgi:hypothetical protein